VPLTEGPGVLQIEADGKWTATVLK
jgi:hypothetical protein